MVKESEGRVTSARSKTGPAVLRYVFFRRLPVLLPQVLAVSLVTFIVVRLLPADPARAILGSRASDSAVAELRRRMGLDEAIFVQYWQYLGDLVTLDLGRSFFTGQPVLTDLVQRTPATLELLFFGMSVAIAGGVVLGVWSAIRRNRGWIVKLMSGYTRLAGSFPDFWLGLLSVFVFFYLLNWAAAPVGRLGIGAQPPDRVTGIHTIDSLLQGDLSLFAMSVRQLILPVLVLGLIQAPIVAKVINTSMTEVLQSEFVRHARACGLRQGIIIRYIVRNALPPVLTVIGILFVFLLGGAVLTEKVFAWGGLGTYAVDAVVNADFAALQGFVLVAAAFTVIMYLLIDVLHMLVDPRVSLAERD